MYSQRQIQTFLAVVRAGSVGGAADVLGISQPTVSSALATLQNDVGVRLLERDGRGIRLTAAGEAFARQARRAGALMEHAVFEARRIAADEKVRLIVGSVPAAAEGFVGPLIAAFTAAAPDIAVELMAVGRDVVGDRLEDWEIELAVIGVPQGTWRTRRLAQRPNDLIVVAAAHGEIALSNALWFVREPQSGTRAATEELLQALGIDPPRRVVGTHSAIALCVERGLGVSLVARDLVQRELTTGTLREIPTHATPIQRPWYLVACDDRPLSPEADRFLTFGFESKVFAPIDDVT